ncbi:hypothetical protein AB0L41_12650 [Amycolatopsis mediterranei]|uniref:WD40 repeat domain-containing protein n=1 Tax=Amycolatopsis mediterranei TaxID=33910 RepID=UPI003439B774
MEIGRAEAGARESGQPVVQWELTGGGPLDEQVHIQVGTVASGYFVDHTGFGRRLFPDNRAAWEAIKNLMGRHRGSWREVECDRAPFEDLRAPDGARVLYDTDGNCLFGHWGEDKLQRWDRYLDAMSRGHTFRRTGTHALLEGWIEAVTYTEPGTGVERHAVVTAVDPGSDHRVVDYPDRAAADAAYEKAVHDHRDAELPYRSSDLPEIPVEPDSPLPDDLVVLDDGAVMHKDDYEYLYGPPPSRITWPRTSSRVAAGRVRGMTASRDWGPGEARVEDVTPEGWRSGDPELRANALVLLALVDGRVLLASAHDGAARVWSARDGSSMREVVGHSEWVLSVALVALDDGQVVLATGGKDGLARVWTVPEGRPVQEIEAHRSPVNAVAWVCPPGEIPWLVTGSDDATVRVRNPDTQREIAVLELGAPSFDIVWSVAATVLADGHVCVVAGTNDSMTTSVHVWDVTTGQRLHRFTIDHDDDAGARGPQVTVVTLADRSFRVAVAVGGTVRVWDGLTGDVVRTWSLPDARESAVAMAVLPDLRVAVAATDGGRTVVRDAESGAELAALTNGRPGFPPAVDLATRPDGGLLLAVGGRGDAPARLLRLEL